MLGPNGGFHLFKGSHHPNQRNRLNPVRMILAGLIRSPMRENPSHQLVLILDRSDEEIPLHSEGPRRSCDVMDVHVRHGRGYERPIPIRDRIVQQNYVNRCRHEGFGLITPRSPEQGPNPTRPRRSPPVAPCGNL